MIPKIIHQTYKDYDLPDVYAMCARQIKSLHSGYEYKFWTDEDMYTFMRTEFPTYWVKFGALPRTIMQIDMFRYFLLYKYGGVYVDLDYYMLRPLDDLMADKELVLPVNGEADDGTPTGVGNCILASRPGHPFWRKLMDSLFTVDRSVVDFDSDNNVDMSEFGTGPGFVYAIWRAYSADDTSIYLPRKQMFHPPSQQSLLYLERLQAQGIYGMHWRSGLWRNGAL
jgi:mannosyltransferase OCH1-like enzyme